MSTPGKRAKYDHLIKLLVIGDACVGKSSLLLRFSENAFSNNYLTTIGIDFKVKSVTINGKRIKLQIWDTAGQERVRTITQAYYRGAMGILLVYDCGDVTSFNNVTNWMRQIEQNASPGVAKIIVANKCDLLDSERAVSSEQGEALAKEYGVSFFETSAKQDTNVSEAFVGIATEILETKSLPGPGSPGGANGADGIKLETAAAARSKGGCC